MTIYAVLQGMFVGAISLVFEAFYTGIIIQEAERREPPVAVNCSAAQVAAVVRISLDAYRARSESRHAVDEIPIPRTELREALAASERGHMIHCSERRIASTMRVRVLVQFGGHCALRSVRISCVPSRALITTLLPFLIMSLALSCKRSTVGFVLSMVNEILSFPT